MKIIMIIKNNDNNVSRKDGGRGLISVEADAVDQSILGFEDYIHVSKSTETLLSTVTVTEDRVRTLFVL